MIGVKQAVIAGFGASAVAGGGYGTYYLLKDKTTIKDNLISRGVALIGNQDEYEVAFIEKKTDKKLVTLLSNVKESSNATQGGNELKVWCEQNLALNLSEKNTKDTLPNVEKYCSKPSSTIEERLTKLNKKQLLKKKSWVDKAKELKAIDSTLAILKTDLGEEKFADDAQNNKVGNALKTWCEKNIKKPLIEDKDEAVWKKVDERCLEDKEQ